MTNALCIYHPNKTDKRHKRPRLTAVETSSLESSSWFTVRGPWQKWLTFEGDTMRKMTQL
jgi:hypothetical protein